MSEATRGRLLWGSRFVALGILALMVAYLPEPWRDPLVWLGGTAFVILWVATGATSLFSGRAARAARPRSGYRGLDLGGGESGPGDRTPNDP